MSKTHVRSRSTRGAALVETAFVLIWLMGLLFAGLQVGLISYYQLAMDLGSHVQARSIALGNTVGVSTTDVVDAALPKLQYTTFAPPQNPNPIAISASGANFNYNDPNNRTGGFTVTAPLPIVSSVTEQGNGILGLGNHPITINSVAVEGSFKELCPHYCLINGGMTNASANDAIDYFNGGDNTAPYFIGFNFMRTCGSDPGADLSKITNYGWTSCPQSELIWRAIGTAAHLDDGTADHPENANDRYQGSGAQLFGYSGLPQAPPSVNNAGPFFELWCHRKIFALIEARAFPNGSIPPFPQDQASAQAFLAQIFGTNPATSPGAIIYSNFGESGNMANAGWDSSQLQGSDLSVTMKEGTLSPWWGCGAF